MRIRRLRIPGSLHSTLTWFSLDDSAKIAEIVCVHGQWEIIILRNANYGDAKEYW